MIRDYDRVKELCSARGPNEKITTDWDQYSSERKESDYLQVLEELSEWEHDRWSAERYIDGWRNAESGEGIKRCKELVFYKDLDRGVQDYDRDSIISQLKMRLSRYRASEAKRAPTHGQRGL